VLYWVRSADLCIFPCYFVSLSVSLEYDYEVSLVKKIGQFDAKYAVSRVNYIMLLLGIILYLLVFYPYSFPNMHWCFVGSKNCEC
jgi:hypothetical protein